MTAAAVLAVLFLLLVIVFRGCQEGEVQREMIDPPTQPLPGTQDVRTPTAPAALPM